MTVQRFCLQESHPCIWLMKSTFPYIRLFWWVIDRFFDILFEIAGYGITPHPHHKLDAIVSGYSYDMHLPKSTLLTVHIYKPAPIH